MQRSWEFSLEPGKLPGSTRQGWGAIRDFNRESRRIRAEAKKARDAFMRNPDLTEEARDRKVAETTEAAAKAAGEAYARLRERVALKLEELRAEAHTPPKREKPSNMTERLLEEVASRLARAEASGAVDQAVKTGEPSELHALYQRLLQDGDERVRGMFERLAPARLESEGKGELAAALRAEIESTAEAHLPEDAKLLLDHADAMGGALEIAEATTAELGHGPSLYGDSELSTLVGMEAGYGAELAGLGE